MYFVSEVIHKMDVILVNFQVYNYLKAGRKMYPVITDERRYDALHVA